MANKISKLNYMHKFSIYKERIRILDERLKETHGDIYGVKSTSYDGMPHTPSMPKGLDTKVIRYMCEEDEMKDEIVKLVNKMKLIKDKIKTIDDCQLITVLELKYIDGLQYKEIADVMQVSEVHVERLRKKAIDRLDISQEEYDAVM